MCATTDPPAQPLPHRPLKRAEQEVVVAQAARPPSLVGDLDDAEPVERLTIALDEVSVEVQLSQEQAAQLRTESASKEQPKEP